MKRFTSFALLLLLSPLSFADDLGIKGNTQLQPYQLVILEANVDLANKYAVWHVTPQTNVDKRIIGGKLVFVAPPGTYNVELTVIDFDKKTGSDAAVTVLIAGAPPEPPPGPSPGPVDPFASSLQQLYSTDTGVDKAMKLNLLIQAFTQSLPSADNQTYTTLSQVKNVLSAATHAVLSDMDLTALRSLIGAEMEKQLGTNPQLPLDPTMRDKIKTQLNRIISALRVIK